MVNGKDLFSNEITWYIIIGAFLAFAYTNFKPEVASGLMIFLFISFMIIMADYSFLDGKLSIPLKSSMKLGKVILISITYALSFIFIGSILTGLNFQSVLKIIQSTIPAFTKSIIMTILTWVGVIPFIESITVIRAYELASNRLKTNVYDLKNIVNWVVIVVIGVFILLLHSTAYGITNNKALLLSFLFFVLGIGLSIKIREARPFAIGHSIINGWAFIS